MRILSILYLVFSLILSASAGELAKVSDQFISAETYRPDYKHKCTHRFTGVFEAGDAEKFKNSNIILLCLDSSGGSLVEALKITEIMKKTPIATVVEAGARCESACALVFMAGGFLPHESDRYTWRVLHPTAKLGFHAPEIVIPSGEYNASSVKNAYRIALKSVSATIANLVQRRGFGGTAMKSSLLGKMLDTPGDSMFYIETVDHAGRWDIKIDPLPKINNPSAQQLVTACINAYSWNDDEAAIFAHKRDANSWWPEKSSQNGVRTGKVLLNEMFETGCEIKIDTRPAESEITIDVGSRTYSGSDTILFFDPSMKLASLFNGDLGIKDANAPNGLCTVYKNRNAIDSEPCIRTIRNKNRGFVVTYQWPSGAKTVVVIDRSRIWINGKETKPAQTIQNQVCIHNPKSGNQFCFQEKK